MQRLSIVQNLKVVVREPKMYCIYGNSSWYIVVRYTEDVRYWEGPLSEVPLYFLNFCFSHAREVFIFPT